MLTGEEKEDDKGEIKVVEECEQCRRWEEKSEVKRRIWLGSNASHRVSCQIDEWKLILLLLFILSSFSAVPTHSSFFSSVHLSFFLSIWSPQTHILIPFHGNTCNRSRAVFIKRFWRRPSSARVSWLTALAANNTPFQPEGQNKSKLNGYWRIQSAQTTLYKWSQGTVKQGWSKDNVKGCI